MTSEVNELVFSCLAGREDMSADRRCRCRILNIVVAILKVTRCWIGSQCSSARADVMCSYFNFLSTTLATCFGHVEAF